MQSGTDRYTGHPRQRGVKRATSLPFHPLRIVKAGLVPAATLVKAGLVPAATFAHNKYNLGTSIQVHRDPLKLEF